MLSRLVQHALDSGVCAMDRFSSSAPSSPSAFLYVAVLSFVNLEIVQVGYHTELEIQIKNRRNNPDSYEHVRTTIIIPTAEPDYCQTTVTFTARNVFGGRV